MLLKRGADINAEIKDLDEPLDNIRLLRMSILGIFLDMILVI